MDSVPWPHPQQIRSGYSYWLVSASNLSIVNHAYHCPVVSAAVAGYKDLLFGKACIYPDQRTSAMLIREASGLLRRLTVIMRGPCQSLPELFMSEEYILKVGDMDNQKQATLVSDSDWGIIRGLETFSQLLYTVSPGVFAVNSTLVLDYPSFPHRGLMIDTSHHYVSPLTIARTLDLMAMNKLNVLHWHIVGDKSFPYQSSSLPNLGKQGAFRRRTHVYLPEDVEAVISYARLRGIRVIPEFNTPGHTSSWGRGFPELLSGCHSSTDGKEQPGHLDPTKETSFSVLNILFSEVAALFPDQFLHVGGWDFDRTCWKANPYISRYMNNSGMKDNVYTLEDSYFKRIFQMVQNNKKNAIVWQDVTSNGVLVPQDALLQVYKPMTQVSLNEIAHLGNKVILSSCWNLSSPASWQDFYACNLLKFRAKQEKDPFVLGGEAWLFSETVDGTNLISQTWPRTSAAAERLWSVGSSSETRNIDNRLQRFRCLMLK